MEAPQFLHRHQINTALWDACVESADNGLIYFRSWYLDALCPAWSALVWGNYEAVMPLPWKIKWSLKYVYQPPFFQRLGVAGNVPLTKALRYAQKHFRFIHYNTGTAAPQARFVTRQRLNYILPLAQPYVNMQQGFSQACRHNIRKAQQRGCRLTQVSDAALVIAAYKNAYGRLNTQAKKEDYDRLHHMLTTAADKKHIALYEVRDDAGNELAQAAIAHDNKRLYYLLGAPTAQGRQKRATYFFIDQMLQQHAGENRLFDFEGSDLPNVAAFYQSFGPQAEYYSSVRITPFTRI